MLKTCGAGIHKLKQCKSNIKKGVKDIFFRENNDLAFHADSRFCLNYF